MASSLISNPTLTTNDRSQRTRKKKKPQSNHHQQQQTHAKWRSQAQQQIYSSKLRQALARVNLNAAASGGPRRGKAVREAADRALAVAAKGKTRWSRAILKNRLRIKFRKKQQKILQQRIAGVGPSRTNKARFGVLRLKGKTITTVQRKVKVLGRLVPGCRKEALPVILEEAIDYIPALEMQVRTMSALADFLFGSSSSLSSAVAGSASSSGLPPPS